MSQPKRPYITCVLAFILTAIYGWQVYDPTLIEQYAFMGTQLEEEPHRFFTGAFLHADLTHLVMNAATLLFLGSVVEAALGHVSMLVVYATALVGGQVAVYMWEDPMVATVGASGAIYGLFGAALVVNLITRSWSALFNSAGIIIINSVVSYLSPGISWQAHTGGLIAGLIAAIPCAVIIITWVRRRDRKEQEKAAQVGQYVYGQPGVGHMHYGRQQ